MWMMMIAITACVKKMGGFSWADMLHRKTFQVTRLLIHVGRSTCENEFISHPQPFVTTCFHHSNLTEMNLTQNILYIFKNVIYRTKNMRNQNHCYYVHKFTGYTHYEPVHNVSFICHPYDWHLSHASFWLIALSVCSVISLHFLNT